MRCNRSCLDLGPPDARTGVRKPLGTRSYPLGKLCCAVAYLRTVKSAASREFVLSMIESQCGAQHAADVRRAMT